MKVAKIELAKFVANFEEGCIFKENLLNLKFLLEYEKLTINKRSFTFNIH